MKNILLAINILTSSIMLVAPCTCDANPKGGKVVGGDATIIPHDNKKLDIIQHTSKAVIDWRSFDINLNEHTEFKQPSSNAIVLNRINGTKKSNIAGQLTANGNVILINPNGVSFKGTSSVDVNGIIAATANIKTHDFMHDVNNFNIPGKANAQVINEGKITAADAGLVGLIAPDVQNYGVIKAKLGNVQLASGDIFTVDFCGDSLLEVAVHNEQIKSQIINKGKILADGGKISMTAAAAEQTIDSLIVADGEMVANSVTSDKNGAIIISAAGSNKTNKKGNSHLKIKGNLSAAGKQPGQQGGKIEALADHIAITSTAVINTSGHSTTNKGNLLINGNSATIKANRKINNGVRSDADFFIQSSRAGGSIKIGGDYLGKGKTQTAKTLYVAKNAKFFNDAIQYGDAGRTILWADYVTKFYGSVFARGGVDGGHGGFLETSGKQYLKAKGEINLHSRSLHFNKGIYLLDPTNISIYGNVEPNFVSTDSSVNLSTALELWLDGDDTNGNGTVYSSDPGETAGALATWVDKSGKNNDASGGTSPFIGTNTINGKNVVTFTGSDGGQEHLVTSGYTPTDLDNVTAYIVAKNGGPNNPGVGSQVRPIITTGNPAFGNTKLAIAANRDADTSLGYLGHGIDGGSYNNLTSGGFINQHIIGIKIEGAGAAKTINGYYDGNPILNTAGPTDDITNNSFQIGGHAGSAVRKFKGDLAEVIVHSTDLSDDNRHILEQYQSAKWAIALTPPGTGGDEPTRAMASDGYNVFTTSYLERLSSSADIVLSADTNIELDLKGASLTLSDEQNISLQTTSGNISTASAGSIITNQTSSAGNITFNAGGNINFDHTFTLNAQNGADINLIASSGSVNITDTLNITNGNLNVTTDNFNITGTLNGSNQSFTYTQGSASSSVDVGSGGSSTIGLTDALISTIKSGFNSYTFGRADGANITNRTSSWDGDVTFLTNSNFTNDVAITTSSNAITVTAGGDIILNQDIATTSASANAIQLNATGNFTNNAGNDALSTGNNWIVYSNNPVGNKNNGLLPAQSLYNQADIATAIGNATPGNNVFAYNTATQPTLTYNVNNNSVIYGQAVAGNGITYASGLVGDDTEGTIGQMNSANITDTYTPGDNIGAYNNIITATQGTLTNLLGYQYAFNPGDLTVNTATLTISGATPQNKVYDNNTAATLTGGSLSGVFGGDDVSFTGNGTFAQATVGNNIAVSGLTISGTDAGNYTLTQPGGLTANITPATLTISGITPQNKVYDTNTVATLTGGSLNGVLGGDTVNFSGNGTFAQTDVGNNISITSGLALGGADASNYTLTQPSGLTANITPATLTISGMATQDKVYDTNTVATLTGGSLSGVLGGDTVNFSGNGTFAQANVGNNITVSGLTLGGADASNYTLTQPGGLTANITPVTLTISGMTTQDKTYDGTTVATLTGGSLSGVLGGDTVNFSGNGTFAQTDVGNNLAVSGLTLSGAQANNYTLTQPGGLTANITKANLNISVNPLSATKSEGENNPSFALSFGSFQGSDTQSDLDSLPTISTTALASSPVGSYPVTLSGGLDNNYNYVFTDGTLSILPISEMISETIIPESVQQQLISQPEIPKIISFVPLFLTLQQSSSIIDLDFAVIDNNQTSQVDSTEDESSNRQNDSINNNFVPTSSISNRKKMLLISKDLANELGL